MPVRYYLYGDRPVKSVPTGDGGLDWQAFVWGSAGKFKRDMSIGGEIFSGDPDAREVSKTEFDHKVAELSRKPGGCVMSENADLVKGRDREAPRGKPTAFITVGAQAPDEEGKGGIKGKVIPVWGMTPSKGKPGKLAATTSDGKVLHVDAKKHEEVKSKISKKGASPATGPLSAEEKAERKQLGLKIAAKKDTPEERARYVALTNRHKASQAAPGGEAEAKPEKVGDKSASARPTKADRERAMQEVQDKASALRRRLDAGHEAGTVRGMPGTVSGKASMVAVEHSAAVSRAKTKEDMEKARASAERQLKWLEEKHLSGEGKPAGSEPEAAIKPPPPESPAPASKPEAPAKAHAPHGEYEVNDKNKIELTFSKADYQALPADVRNDIKRFYNFSRSIGGWVSKARSEDYTARRIAERAGFAHPEKVEIKQIDRTTRHEGYTAPEGLKEGQWHKASVDDIDKRKAQGAHSWSSWDPEKRGEASRQEYVQMMDQAAEALKKHATTPEKQAKAKALLEDHRKGLLSKFNAEMEARSRTASAMVTGPAKFPTRRNEKALDVHHKRQGELFDHQKQGISRMVRELNDSGPIMSHHSDATQRLQEQVDDAVKTQERYKAINKIAKSSKGTTDEKVARLVSELGMKESIARKIMEPDYGGRIGIPAYELTNNNANIRRMQARIEDIKRTYKLDE